MANLKILSVKELLKDNLSIPDYQRPYKWDSESAATLFIDIYSAFSKKLPEYRIGSIILHSENDKLNIVDGQQRLTTLSILIFCFSQLLNDNSIDSVNFIKAKVFSPLSQKAINTNYELLKRKCLEVKANLSGLENYVLNSCSFVRIITDSEQEAFQFFDSQNSRGKELAPHDLLKSYHLREMKYDNEATKIKTIDLWESTNQKDLKIFFEVILYPLVCWYKNKSGLYYSSKKIKTFKGIKQNNNYNFSVYHKAANLYIEHFNEEGMYELSGGEYTNQFQLTQPIISGRRFFQYTLHYFNLYIEVRQKIQQLLSEKQIDTSGSGNTYVKNMFINIVIFFIDKFNVTELTDSRLNRLFTWAYSLRVVMHSVYPETVNNYVLGRNSRVNNNLNLFAKIYDMQSPQELDLISLEKVDYKKLNTYKSYNYENIWKKLFGEENE